MDVNNTAATMRRLDDTETPNSSVLGTFRNQSQSPYQFQQQQQVRADYAAKNKRLHSTIMGLVQGIVLSLVQFVVIVVAEILVLMKHLAELSDLNAIYVIHPDWLLLANEATYTIIPFAEANTIYEGLFIAAQIFLLILSVDAILSSSKIQLVATTIFNLAVVGYSVDQYIQSGNLIDQVGSIHYGFLQSYGFQFHRTAPYEIIVISLGILFFFLWTFVATKLYNLFGWNVFKELGADVEVRIFGDEPSTNKTITIVLTPIAVVGLLLVAYFSVTRESNILMTLLLIALSGCIGFLVDRIIDIWTVTDMTKYKSCKTSLTLFSVLTLIAALATFAVAVLNFLNFGKGLMQS
ncbi:hypothetical protein HK100_009137, partial [Physocladia obscura]